MISGPGTKIRQLEKLAYVAAIPSVMAIGAYAIYNKNVLQADERAERLRKVEEKFLSAYPENMIKLQNFKKRVFAIGTVDDLGVPDRDTEEHKVAISKNAAMIRDFIRDMAPE